MSDIAYLLLGAVLVLVAYRMGLNDRKRVDSGKQLLTNPVAPIVEAMKTKKEQAEASSIITAMENLMAYDGTKQKKPKEV